MKKKSIDPSNSDPKKSNSESNADNSDPIRIKCGQRTKLKKFLERNNILPSEISFTELKNLLIDNKLFKAIFGPDNRKELHEIHADKIEAATKAAAIIHESLLKEDSLGYTIIPSGQMIFSGRGRKLCEFENFYGQPEAAYCTSCALHERIAIIPKHATRNFFPDQMRLVYGFWNDGVNSPLQIPKENVKRIERVIDDPSDDLSFLILKDPVGADQIITKHKKPKQGQNIFVSGYPGTAREFNRIPLKIAGNAEVKKVNNTRFQADLDIFKGNSGSPVFNDEHFIGMFISVPSDHFAPFSRHCDLSCYCDESDSCAYAVCINSDYIISKMPQIKSNL